MQHALLKPSVAKQGLALMVCQGVLPRRAMAHQTGPHGVPWGSPRKQAPTVRHIHTRTTASPIRAISKTTYASPGVG